jgi:hypothetical protein
METNPIYATTSGIRTYLDLLEGSNVLYMHYMFILHYTRLYMLEMEGHEWMYTGRVRRDDVTPEWIKKTDAFLEQAFGEAAKGASLVPCPYNKCAIRKRKTKKAIGKHIWKNGFMLDYTRWIFHCEAHHTREKVVRQLVEDYDDDVGVADMLNDYHEAQFIEGCTEDELEVTAKAFYDMFDVAQKLFYDKTKVSQLDVIIGCIMAFKLQYSLSREPFNGLLTVIGSLLTEDHVLQNSMYEAQKLLALKMTYEQIHACPKDCVLFRKEYAETKYCSKYKSFRFIEEAARHPHDNPTPSSVHTEDPMYIHVGGLRLLKVLKNMI